MDSYINSKLNSQVYANRSSLENTSREHKLCVFLYIMIATVIVTGLIMIFILYHSDSSLKSNAEEWANKFDGDMILNIEQMDNIFELKNNSMNNVTRKWPNGVVYYKIDRMFDRKHVQSIQKAFEEISRSTCVRFQLANCSVRNYVIISGRYRGCSSQIGYQKNRQYLNLESHKLGTGCFRTGTILHELLHTLGFYHEHNAPDRDKYIKINWVNVKNENICNFWKFPSLLESYPDDNYDYDSVMHCAKYSFSKNNAPTVVPLMTSANIGQRTRLSSGDIIKINTMYQCQT